MLKYLIIPLSSNAISFCHYNVVQKERYFISPEILKAAIKWSMMENLSIQFIYPSEELPHNVDEIAESIDHTKIIPADYPVSATRRQAQVVVFDSWKYIGGYEFSKDQAYIIRTNFRELLKAEKEIVQILQIVNRLNIVITDIDSVSEDTVKDYQSFLYGLVPILVKLYSQGRYVQFNLITDRAMITEMNNCNAGVESIALSVDGNFFICPGFENDGCKSDGSLTEGILIKNGQLLKLENAPICRICDAYHCKRCVWLNRRLTHEVNTPGRVQCLMSHIERNTSEIFLANLHSAGVDVLSEMSIGEIDYLDPLDKIINS